MSKSKSSLALLNRNIEGDFLLTKTFSVTFIVEKDSFSKTALFVSVSQLRVDNLLYQAKHLGRNRVCFRKS